jgi:HSP20 family protein
MVFDLAPRSVWRVPSVPNLWDDEEDWGLITNWPSGISISEDDKNVYIETAVPGVDSKDIEVTFDRGVVWIKGENKQEEKNKKFYRKAASSFSYRVAVPGDIDPNAEPMAAVKNGVMKVTFAKSPAIQPKKISVQEEK